MLAAIHRLNRVERWLYNGFHAEHHYRPKIHWTRMVALREQIRAEQRAAGVHVMGHCHALGFLDRTPPQYTVVQNPQHAAA